MARRTSIPGDQLARLRERYAEERRALFALAAADRAVTNAQARVTVAEQALADALTRSDGAYQTLAALLGAETARQETGRSAPPRRVTARRPAETAGPARQADIAA